jgi:PAS domain S-box-containing protein
MVAQMSSAALPARDARDGVTSAFTALGAEIDTALDRIGVVAAVIDRDGLIRYQNERARASFGNLVGGPFTDILAPESKSPARLDFARKMLGTERASDAERWLRTLDGDVLAEVHVVAIEAGNRVVGIFGIAAPVQARSASPTQLARSRLTPRQLEVLQYLAEGRSTAEIAAAMGIARETVRNHVRAILRTLAVHSRLEAVVEAHRRSFLAD